MKATLSNNALTSSELINEILTVFTEGGRSDGTVIEWGTDVDVIVLLNSNFRKQQSRGDMKNNIHE